MWLFISGLALLALLPLLQGDGNPPPAKANSAGDKKYTRKLMVDNQLAPHINEQLKQEGAILLMEYKDRTLWRLTEEQSKIALNKLGGWSSYGLKFIEQEDKFQRNDGTILDRSFGAPEPDAPPEFRQHKIEGYQLWSLMFAGPGTEQWYKTIRDMGIEEVHSFRPSGMIIWATGKQIDQLEAMVSPSSFVQWTGPLHPYTKLQGNLHPSVKYPVDLNSLGLVKVSMTLYRHATVGETVAKLQAMFPTIKVHATYIANIVYINLEIPANQILTIAHFPDLRGIGLQRTGSGSDERQGQLIAGNITTGQNSSVPSGTGYLTWLASKNFPTNPDSYPVVAVVDSGIDNGTLSPSHPDFLKFDNSNFSRLISVYNCTSSTDVPFDIPGHGTLVAGIIGAYNNRSPAQIHQDTPGYRRGLGVSPYGKLVNIKILDNNNQVNFSSCQGSIGDIISASYNANAKITNNSWGFKDVFGNYGEEAVLYDILTRDASSVTPGNQGMLHVFAIGNSGNKGLRTVENPGTAKNVLTIGATEGVRDGGVIDGCWVRDAANADNIANFSAHGPTNDGRAKPDLVAPGTHIQGQASQVGGFNGLAVCGGTTTAASQYYPFPGATAPQNVEQTLYTWGSGTSFAAPAASGAAQLVYEYYSRVLMPGQNPSPAMLKALLINAARYLNGAGSGDDLPSPRQGWGALNLAPIVDNTPRHLLDQDTILTVDSPEHIYYGTIADPAKPLRVTLVWTDPPGDADDENPAQNDLNLEVTVGGQVYKGNVFKKAFSLPNGEFDTINNVENVFLPPGLSGSFRVKVRAETLLAVGVPGSGITKNQDFALVVYNSNPAASSVILGQGVVNVSDATPNGNGNGSAEPNELLKLFIPVANNGNASATNVSSVLQVDSAAATLVSGQPPVNYGTIAPNTIITPTSSVDLRLNTGLPCGTLVVLTQTITYNSNQQQNIVFKLATGSPLLGTPVTYHSSDVPKDIPDKEVSPPLGELGGANGGAVSSLTIAPAGKVGKLKVKLSITHTFDGDLRVILTAPDGKQANLISRRGSIGDNFTNTILDDAATQSIADGEAPFNGSFRPETPLAAFIGSSFKGEWQLRVFDESNGDSGTLDSWSLEIVADSGYTCAPYEVTAASIAVVSGSNQNVLVNNPFALPFQVRVRDGSNNLLSGALVTFTAPIFNNNDVPSGTFAGTGTISFSGTTDSNGTITAPIFTANQRAGNYEVQAKVAGVNTPAKFSLTNTPGNPTQVLKNPLTPQSATVNTAYAATLKARVVDQFNNGVSGVNVVFSLVAGSNGASGTFPGNNITFNTTTNADGLATAPTLTANTIAGNFTLKATATEVADPAIFNLTNKAGPPASLIRTAGSGQSTVVGTVFGTALKATVQDSFNNPVEGVNIIFSAVVGSDGTSAVFTGNLAVFAVSTDANGVAAVRPKANEKKGVYEITANISGGNNIPLIRFFLFNESGAPARLNASAGTPQGTDINSPFATLLKVQVQDSFGNGISGTNVTFTPPANGASGSFGGSAIVTSDANGYTEAPVFTANAITGTYNVVATASGFSTQFQLTNWLGCSSAQPFVVTTTEDDGSAIVCGTLSRALLQASGPTTITFNLLNFNTVVKVNAALPPVKPNVTLSGNGCNEAELIRLEGSSAPVGTNGLILSGGATLRNLRVSGFKGQQIVARNKLNFLSCVVARRN